MKNTKHVAVIDDSESVLLLIQKMLSCLGYEKVSCFSCPQTALDEINIGKTHYDVVFTNLGMPDIDGMCVIRELGKMNFRGAVCIISDLENRVTELAAEIAKLQWVYLLGSISKPITLDALEKTLNKLPKPHEMQFQQNSAMAREALIKYLINGSVVPYYQPKVNPVTRCVESVEVLARILDADSGGVILPGSFLSTAVQHDLVDLLTTTIAEKTASDMETLSAIFGQDVTVSINLSAEQLDDLSIPNRLGALFKEKNVLRQRITLEITEESALNSPEQLESLNRLRMQGFGVSLDDFGTGFANFRHLRHLPFTEVKVDRSLISKIHTDHFGQAIVRSLADFSLESECKVVAEGVELDEELAYLTSHYPNMLIQGFLICHPKPIEELEAWYVKWEAQCELSDKVKS
ncbi:diguanylate phosphodiesterase [Grimontia sp. AD028]|uniref:Diguanylate cyclase/phosphodiesterase n=1 Tax=Grimontia indica TaxID=1056512 RepID=R1IR40_9GAMM|nr:MULTISPECIES: EAL domain-containing response regulator [Grimontia]EOD79927.1 diguanylate cyclase/phosphodiesterase [Grimontia indica]KKD61216.1 diguanylate phosphodiesterase [Grimontia sp. AD028]